MDDLNVYVGCNQRKLPECGAYTTKKKKQRKKNRNENRTHTQSKNIQSKWPHNRYIHIGELMKRSPL